VQVEFYFSDSNLPRDDFLSKTVNESEDGSILLPFCPFLFSLLVLLSIWFRFLGFC